MKVTPDSRGIAAIVTAITTEPAAHLREEDLIRGVQEGHSAQVRVATSAARVAVRMLVVALNRAVHRVIIAEERIRV